jgi:tRNA G46 methylase TrmB
MLPDKKTHKNTITYKLREDILNEARNYEDPVYLEIGFDKGYTLKTMAESGLFSKVIGIDISTKMCDHANGILKDFGDLCDVRAGTVETFQEGEMAHIVLIDAAHDYKNVKNDAQKVLARNGLEKFTIFFHDLGLPAAGVKDYLEEYHHTKYERCGEESNWRHGGKKSIDWEAARLRIEP